MVTMISWRKKKDGTKTEWRYMKCSAYRRGGKHLCQGHPPIRYENFREFVINQLLSKGKEVNFTIENNLEQKSVKQLENAERQLSLIEGKQKDLLKVFLEKIISMEEFKEMKSELESKEIELKSEITKLSSKKFNNHQIETVKKAFEELNKKGDDLYQVFHALLNKITVHHDGTVDFEYSFEK